MDHVELLFVKMSSSAVKPTRATEKSVGLDFYSPANYIIPPYNQLLIPTQIKLRIPLGHYGRLASKSGLAICTITCGCGSYRPRLYGRNKSLTNKYSPMCPLYCQGRSYSSINFGGSITSHTKEGKGTSTHY